MTTNKALLVCVAVAAMCLSGLAQTKEHEMLKYSTTAVKTGVWSTQFDKCKKLAVQLGVPLVVLWVNPGCAHCRELCNSMAMSDSFTNWRKKCGFVFVLGIGTSSKTGEKVKSFTKHDKNTTLSDYPFCAVYLNPRGSASPTVKKVFSGNGITALAFKKQVLLAIKNYKKVTIKAGSGVMGGQVSWMKGGKTIGNTLTMWQKVGKTFTLKTVFKSKINFGKNNATYKVLLKKE